MKLTFIGACHEVTGSMHLLETKDTKILIDCGMEQGGNVYENADMPVEFNQIDYLLLTHAHIDHAGMIPYAYKNGFNGTVITTNASMDLDSIMLLDSAHIQEQEAEWQNRKGKRSGKGLVEPAYIVEDAKQVIKQFKSIPYHRLTELSDTVSIQLIDAGHLLGSASIEVYINEDGIEKKIVFSGDIGNFSKPLIRDPEYITSADYVVMESTYGDRLHDRGLNHIAELADIIQRTLDRNGNVVIPAFAVGRTQEILYMIRHIKSEGLVSGHDGFPVYVDSPLAVQATSVFKENLLECYDEETKELVMNGINPIQFPELRLSLTADDSKAINFDTTPKVIISASGMCDAGRIRHHLKHNLWRPECSVVFAGYQAEGTLGRLLQDGADTVRLFGEEINVRAHIETMGGMSSHADRNGLMTWISAYTDTPSKVFLVHGEHNSMESFADLVREKLGFDVECPYSGSEFDLAKGEFIYKAEPVFIHKEREISVRNNAIYDELLETGSRINELIASYKVGCNKDIKSLTKALNELVEKWKMEE